ncbi:MAG: AtuA-related protein, partial [Acidimicrobiia bacterium]
MRVVVGDDEVTVEHPRLDAAPAAPFQPGAITADGPAPSGTVVRVPLSRLCLARSGDKGDTANVGLLARSPAVYAWMVDTVTAAFVKGRFAEICRGEVERSEIPNLLAVNFLLHQSLGGGGTLSLLLDGQGKTYAQYLLAAEVEVDEALLAGVE